MQKLEFHSKDEEIQFLRKVLDTMPVMININQINDFDDQSSHFSLWSNKQANDFLGYSREEIDELGFGYFLETMHPDEMELIGDALTKFQESNKPIYGGVVRLKPKNGDYHRFIGSMAVLETKDGRPWRVLVAVQNMEEMNDTRNQIIQLIRENLRLKNELKIQNLSKREKQIIKLIAGSQTDKEIALDLSISPATVKTHRHNIIKKLHLKNKVAIAHFATENGLD
jgi:DNA-binding CsgD family transcriptional regulator